MGLCNFSGRLRVDFEVPWGLSGAIQLSRVNVPLDFVALRLHICLCKCSEESQGESIFAIWCSVFQAGLCEFSRESHRPF